ncbi:hypothetical protein Q3G72_009555 [Acer saccharum]|nr:hypothetical protein Q3G72_009555 [Acer saccharum]
MKDLAGSIKIHTDMEEVSSSNPQIKTLEGIPVIDSQDHIAWPPSDSKDGDLEMQNHKSSEKFPILPQRAATFGM